jgi:hypothetical protein
MIMMVIGAVVSALLIGFAVGLVSFKVKSRWCLACGATTIDLARRYPPAGLSSTPRR